MNVSELTLNNGSTASSRVTSNKRRSGGKSKSGFAKRMTEDHQPSECRSLTREEIQALGFRVS